MPLSNLFSSQAEFTVSGILIKKHSFFKNECFLLFYYSPVTYGSKAIVRARLIAIVNLR